MARKFTRINRTNSAGPKRGGSVVQQLRSLQRAVKNLAPEVKYIDVTTNLTDVPTAGSVAHLSLIAQGDTQGGRTGNTINVTSISVKGAFTRAADNLGANDKLMWAIVVDKEQGADTNPTATEVFGSTDPFVALPDLDHLERFKFLYVSKVLDPRMMGLDSDATTPPTRDNAFDFQWTGNLKVSYNGSTTGDIEKNGIFVVVLSSTAALQDWVSITRIGFTDC